jgi:hypothetical protein
VLLRITPWQMSADFARYGAVLRALHAMMESDAHSKVSSHGFLITAQRTLDVVLGASDRIRRRENCTKVQAETVLPPDVRVSMPSQDVGVWCRLRKGRAEWTKSRWRR